MQGILEWLASLPAWILYGVLAVSAFVENVFPPIPGDTVTAFGAFLVGIDRLDFFLVYSSTTAGSVTGFMFLFLIGKRLGRAHFLKRDYKYFPKDKILRAEAWFQKYGYYLVVANRFMPGVRSVISIVAGISNLRIKEVFIFSLISCMLWNALWISAGYALGTNWEVMQEKLSAIMFRYNTVIIFLAGIIGLFLIIKKVVLSKYRKKHDSQNGS